MQFHISNILYTQLTEMSREVLDTIKQHFQFPNPKFAENRRLGFSTFGVPESIHLYETTENYLSLRRGALGQLLGLFPGEVELVDETVTVSASLPDPGFELKDFQVPIVEALLRKNQGIAISACGTGKTICGLYAMLKRRQRALILVHTRDLAQQWRQRLKDFAAIDAGLIGDGKFDDRHDIVVALVQSLNRPLPEEFCRGFGLVAIDEVHHTSCATFQTVVGQFPARFRFGLSASKVRRDRMEALAYATVGPILFEVERNNLAAAGEVMTPKVVGVRSDTYAPVIDSHNDLLAAVCQDQDRNRLIADISSCEASQGHFVIVLSSRIDHLTRLAGMLADTVKFSVMTGRDSAAHRDATLQKMNDGEINLILSTLQLFAEGIDLPRADRLILATPARSPELIKQAVGRISRNFPGKKAAIVFDIVDPFISLAVSQFDTRKRTAYRDFELVEATGEEVRRGYAELMAGTEDCGSEACA